ncbi:hypothetical protein HDU85_005930 [Gaertneriomyces sp. JEL0708]|nr:hypothetical protein HDU85_005930 [Gaertneriomyces sp. JEL0708]
MISDTSERNIKWCLEQRFRIRDAKLGYYTMVEREMMLVDHNKFEDVVNSAYHTYIPDDDNIDDNTIIVFEAFWDDGGEYSKRLEAVRKMNSIWNKMRINLKSTTGPRHYMKKNIDAVVNKHREVDALWYGDGPDSDSFEYYVEELARSNLIKNIVILVTEGTWYKRYTTHSYMNNYTVYNAVTCLELKGKGTYEIASMLDSFSRMYARKFPMYRGMLDKPLMLDTVLSGKNAHSKRGVCSVVFRGDTPSGEEGCRTVLYFPYLSVNEHDNGSQRKYALIDQNIIGKKTLLMSFIDDSLKFECDKVYLILTESLYNTYLDNLTYIETKFASIKSKTMVVMLDLTLMYDPWESDIVPLFEQMDLDEVDLTKTLVLGEQYRLPKLNSIKDVACKHLGLRKGDVVKITRKSHIIYKQVV